MTVCAATNNPGKLRELRRILQRMGHTVRSLRELGIEEQRLNVVASFGNTDAVMMSVKEGIGISVISRLAAQDKLERGDILDFKLSESGSYRSIYMVTSQIHPASDPAQKLIGLVKKLYGCAGT